MVEPSRSMSCRVCGQAVEPPLVLQGSGSDFGPVEDAATVELGFICPSCRHTPEQTAAEIQPPLPSVRNDSDRGLVDVAAAPSEAPSPASPAPTGFPVTSHAEMLYFSTIRLLSTRVGRSRPEAASAFAVSHANDLYLVTARHVVEGVADTTLHLYQGDSVHTIGPPLAFQVRQEDRFWTFHPDSSVDVAVGRLDPVLDFFTHQDLEPFIGHLSTETFQPRAQPGAGSFTDKFWHPLPLDEVLIVGYPQDYRDVPTSLPILRRGRIATPLWLDHRGDPVFLVDAAVYPGTSGGPVAYVEEEHHVGKTMYEGTGKVILLGVFSEVFPPKPEVSVSEGVPQRPPHLGAVYKAHTILEVIAAMQTVSEEQLGCDVPRL